MSSALLPRVRSRAISLTPLIDVVFILLLFFMLTSSFIREKQIDLAAPVASTTVEIEKAPLVLRLSADGSWQALPDGEPLSTAQLSQRDVSQTIVIAPEESARVQVIVSAVEQLKALGFDQLSIGHTVPDAAVRD